MLKKYIFFPLLACLAASTQAAHITGILKNAAPGERVELFVPHYYVDGQSDNYWAELDADRAFSIEATLPEPQLAFFKYNDDRLPVFLEPGDTLVIRADVFQFPVVVQFSGRGGANNRLLQQYFKQNPPDFDELNNLRFKIGQWWAVVEQTMNERMEALPRRSSSLFWMPAKTPLPPCSTNFQQNIPVRSPPHFMTGCRRKSHTTGAITCFITGRSTQIAGKFNPIFSTS